MKAPLPVEGLSVLIVVWPRREEKAHLVVEQGPAAELREGRNQPLLEIGWAARLR
jgi:hypothetical protein